LPPIWEKLGREVYMDKEEQGEKRRQEPSLKKGKGCWELLNKFEKNVV